MTAQELAMPLLELLGYVSLDPADGEPSVKPAALRNVARIITQALQVAAKDSPIEGRTRPASGYLHAPTSITLTATIGSTAISVVTTWATWMEGCTVRVTGDPQDNEILSATLLARPFTGASASGIAATVYGDCITLPASAIKVIAPMIIGDTGQPIAEVTGRKDFLARGFTRYGSDFPLLDTGFLCFSGFKPTGIPSMFFVDGYAAPDFTSIKRRLRFSPMPAAALSVGFSTGVNAMRVTSSDIRGVTTADPGTVLPVLDDASESVLYPIAAQLLTGLGTFHNDGAKPEILRQYQDAIRFLRASRASGAPVRANYISIPTGVRR